MYRIVTITTLLILIHSPLADDKNSYQKFTEKYGLKNQVIYYFDHRDYNTLGITTSVSKLPAGFSIWGFTDFHGNQLEPRDRARLTNSFSEYRLSYNLEDHTGIKGLAFQSEFNYFSRSDTKLGRFGLTYKHNLPTLHEKSWLQWRLFPAQTDDNNQISLIYFLPITDKISINGFADYNINEQAQDRWVIEPQLNYQFTQYLSAHIEYRYNGFQKANDRLRGHGIAIGLGLTF